MRFLEVLAENKRLVYLKEICDKYAKLYGEFNNQEKVTIISAATLSAAQEADVLAALQANPANAGKDIAVEYKVDEAIIGGLQMYTSSEFMDMSLASRVSTLKEEVAKMCA